MAFGEVREILVGTYRVFFTVDEAKKIMAAYVILERVLLAHSSEVAGLLPWSGAERLTLLIQPRGEYRVIGEAEAEATLRAANAKALL